MTPEEILAKVSNGELSGDKLDEVVNDLSVEQQADLKKKASEDVTKSLSEMSGVRKEKQRIEELVAQKQKELDTPLEKKEPQTPPATAKDETMSQFRDEQKQKAIQKFKSDFGLSDEENQVILENFKKIDSGKVDAEFIYQDLVGAYAFVNKDKLVEADKERQAREAAAATANAENAGGMQGKPNNGNQPPKYSDTVTNVAQKAGITLEAAKKVVEEGTKREWK